MAAHSAWGYVSYHCFQLGYHSLIKSSQGFGEGSAEAGPERYHILFFNILIGCSLCIKFLNWDWTPQSPPIHLYYKDLLRENSYEHIYRICDHFITHVHQLIFSTEMPRLSAAGRESISLIENWYMLNNFTCIQLLGII